MKMKFKLLLIALPLLIFTACDKNEGYSLNDYWVDIATVENPEGANAFFLKLDNGVRLWTAAKSSYLYYYTPKDSQRIIANYTILYDVNKEGNHKHDIKLNEVYEILTKSILIKTPEIEDSIGNDPIKIERINIAGDYLDIKFSYWGDYKIHYINLLQEAPEESSTDINPAQATLEFRHNANGDYANYRRTGRVSFKLKSLKAESDEKIKLIIKAKESDSKTTTYELEYKPKAPNTNNAEANVEIPATTTNIE